MTHYVLAPAPSRYGNVQCVGISVEYTVPVMTIAMLEPGLVAELGLAMLLPVNYRQV